jgi:capsular polysaccharide biosynthesis protein
VSETGQTEKFALRGVRLRRAKLRFLLSRASSKALREPLRKIRAPIRNFLLGFVKGFPVELQAQERLPIEPYAGRLPSPGTRCVVYDEATVSVRGHPLSRNSTTRESAHYKDRTFVAPNLTLESPGPHFWFSRTGLLLSPEGKIWPHSMIGPYQPRIMRQMPSVSMARDKSGESRFIFHPSLVKAPPRIAEERLLIVLSDSAHFGHFLLDSATLVHLATQIGAPMLSWPLTPWQRAICDRLGVRPGQIREISRGNYLLDRPVTSNRLTGLGANTAHPRNREAFDTIRANTPVEKFSDLPRRFYIMRGVRHGRILRNRAELAEALAARGVAPIQPDLLSFDEQVALFARAELVVAEFGAAMANLVFSPPGTKVVEIICEGQNDWWSSNLCAMLDLEHVVQFQRLTEEELRAGAIRHVVAEDFSYSADVAAICATVDQWI